MAEVFYNDCDQFCVEWLKKLISGKLLPRGIVDSQSIVDINPWEVSHFDQCHFFAGIGGWPLALEIAGWRGSVWTGSCPCQPFSSAGKHRGPSDERHLWPEFRRLIAECQPSTVFGEQVASKAGRKWLAGVRADLEALGYVVGAADLCAASQSAPHIRQRLFWVAYVQQHQINRLANTNETGSIIEWSAKLPEDSDAPYGYYFDGCSKFSGLGNSCSNGLQIPFSEPSVARETRVQRAQIERPSYLAWSDTEWLPCLDGKARRVEPGTFPLAHGVSNRMGRLRGYGNAIVPQVAAAFIRAFMECHN